MNDFEVDELLEAHVRRTLHEIAQATPCTNAAATPAKRPPSQRRMLVASAAILAVGIGGLIAVSQSTKSRDTVASLDPSRQSSGDSGSVVALPTVSVPVSGGLGSGSGPSGSGVDVPEGLIPGSVSSSDTRSPIQRFVGLPVDPKEAELWDARARSGATAACMRERGFDFFVTSDDVDVAANDAYFSKLTPDQANAYMANLFGVPEAPSGLLDCDQEAGVRVYVLNAFEKEYAIYDQRFYSDPRVVEATEVTTACVERLSGTDRPIAEASSTVIEQCEGEAGWDAVRTLVIEETETAFIVDNADELIEFRDNHQRYSQRKEVQG